MDLKEEEILGDKIYHHWYYLSKGEAICSILENIQVPEVLDVGAGSGIFSTQLLDNNICKSAICIDPNYSDERVGKHEDKNIYYVRDVENVSQKLILMMDVLEHVSCDFTLLNHYSKRLPVDGYVLITVPAFQFMWSGHDIFLEHYRRYTIKTVEVLAEKAGLTPIKSRYFFASLFPILACSRVINNILIKRFSTETKSQIKVYPNWINLMLKYLHSIERKTLFKINKLFGLSVICLCQKKQK